VSRLSSIVFCFFSAPLLPRFDFDEDAVSDFLFVPAAGFGEESFWDEGLEPFPASLADDLVPAILRRDYSDRKVTGRYKSENRLSLDESGRIGDQPRIFATQRRCRITS